MHVHTSRFSLARAITALPISLHKWEGLERWKGKVALVTGASTGIDGVIARLVAEKGLTVHVIGAKTLTWFEL